MKIIKFGNFLVLRPSKVMAVNLKKNALLVFVSKRQEFHKSYK